MRLANSFRGTVATATRAEIVQKDHARLVCAQKMQGEFERAKFLRTVN